MVTYGGTIVALPQRSGKELEATSPPNSGQLLPQQGSVVLIKLDAGGTKAVEISNIRDVTFKDGPKTTAGSEELRNLLTLKLDWADGKPAKQADVGLMYVQLGLRWIPSYKVVIDGKGGAAVKLEGTLVNELCDLDDVAANLVIGVPTSP